VCLLGIGICGRAGIGKERELPASAKQATVAEFSFVKGVWVAIFAGVMSACMAFAFAAGKPIGDLAGQMGFPDHLKNTPLLIVILAGGFTTNFVWCILLNLINGTFRDYGTGRGAPLRANYFFSALAGSIWYLQFFFYSMGTTRMGRYDFSSWTLHMAFIIIFSNLWGLALLEWKGTSRRVHRLILLGILVLVASTLVVGAGNYLAARHSAA
jgi:L-rhamnose-H+ transport protein